jgi:hypothetical protein
VRGYGYDGLGNSITVPAADVGATGGLTLSYFVTDMVASMAPSKGSAQKTRTLDPTGRLHTETDSATGLISTNHYVDGSDSPSWIADSNGSWTRNLEGIDGLLAATISNTGGVELQLTNLHGDVVATMPNSSSWRASSGLTRNRDRPLPWPTNWGCAAWRSK